MSKPTALASIRLGFKISAMSWATDLTHSLSFFICEMDNLMPQVTGSSMKVSISRKSGLFGGSAPRTCSIDGNSGHTSLLSIPGPVRDLLRTKKSFSVAGGTQREAFYYF